MEYKRKFDLLAAEVKRMLEESKDCHDWHHTERVLRNARQIAAREKKASMKVVELASLLHDICRPEEFSSKGRKCHARMGAEKSVEMLREFGLGDKETTAAVSECVRRHRYRASDRPVTIEEKIVFDADKLDSLGAIGIGRAFHFAGRIGAEIHNSEEAALKSESYSREDTAYREYLVKLMKIPEAMLTKTGKKLAIRRHKFMERYFRELNREVFGK